MAAIQYLREAFEIDGSRFVDEPVWPPREHRARLNNYLRYEMLFDGRHWEALDERELKDTEPIYVAANLAKNIVTVVADMLFGEPLTLEPMEDGGNIDPAQEIFDRNDLQAMLYETALDVPVDGDGMLEVSRGEDGLAIIKALPVSTWVPIVNPDDNRDVQAHVFFWVRHAADPVTRSVKPYLRAVIHEKGRVSHVLHELRGDKVGPPASDAVWEQLYPDGTRPPETIETGVDDFLVVHIPNQRSARSLFGQSEYADVEGLFASLNARLTQVDSILTRHSRPILGLPSDHYKALKGPDGGGRIDRDRLDVVAQGQNGELPQYVTWDGQLAQNLSYIEQLVSLIAQVSETAPQLLGRGDFGGDLSGRALRILLIRTLAKVNRRRVYFERAIEKALSLAQQLEGQEPVEVRIQWPDGLPMDTSELVEGVGARLNQGTMSKLRAVMRLDEVDEEAAQQLLDEIEAEDAAHMETVVSANAVATGGRPPIRVNVGREALEE